MDVHDETVHGNDAAPFKASAMPMSHGMAGYETGPVPRQGLSKSKALERSNPPTSWRSTSKIEAVLPEPKDELSSATRGRGDVDARFARTDAISRIENSPKAPMFLIERSTGASEGEKTSHRKGSTKPTQPFRRRYSIVSSNPGLPASAASPSPKRNHSRPANGRHPSQTVPLPTPETAYAQSFYYTACCHTSPPKSRPLNVQPTFVQCHSGLLAYPPPQLQNLGAKVPHIQILMGSCSDCDLSARRQKESAVLDRYAHKLDNLWIQLSLLQKNIHTEQSEAQYSPNHGGFSAFQLSSTLELAPDTTRGILDIEDQLEKLVRQRDHEVRQIWTGFTARWGPATIGLHLENNISVQARLPSVSNTHCTSDEGATSSNTSFELLSANETPDRPFTMTSAVTASTNKMAQMSTPSRRSSHSTKIRTSSVADRYSDGTYGVSVDSAIDGIRSRGRMVVDWIRPDCSEGGKKERKSNDE